MIIVDNALKARAASGKPIQVGMIGAGFMGRGIANQMVNSVPGMRLAAIANRRGMIRRCGVSRSATRSGWAGGEPIGNLTGPSITAKVSGPRDSLA